MRIASYYTRMIRYDILLGSILYNCCIALHMSSFIPDKPSICSPLTICAPNDINAPTTTNKLKYSTDLICRVIVSLFGIVESILLSITAAKPFPVTIRRNIFREVGGRLAYN